MRNVYYRPNLCKHLQYAGLSLNTTYNMTKYLFALFLSIILFSAFSQNTGTIFGKISSEQKSPIELVNISIKGKPHGIISDAKGKYLLNIPASESDTIIFSFTGFEPQQIPITIKAGEQKELNVILKRSSKQIKTVTVTNQRERENNITRLNPKILTSLPGATIGGIENTIKTLPGVRAKSELSSQYSVRGGNFDENLVYVNGIQIYRPGLIRSGQQEGMSFINPKLITSITFSSGGFEAQYGDKMSSVLDITYKRPREFEGSADINFMGADAHMGGISKNNRFTHISGIRYRNTQFILKTLDDKGEYKPIFADLQTFMSYRISEKITSEFLGYSSMNKYTFIPKDGTTTFGSVLDARQMRIYYEGQEVDKYNTYMGSGSVIYTPIEKLKLKTGASYFFIDEEETYDILSEYYLNQIESIGENSGDSVANIAAGGDLRHARNYLDSKIISGYHNGTLTNDMNTLQWGIIAKHEEFEHSINKWKYIDSADYSLPTSETEFELRDVSFNNITHTNTKIGGYLSNTKRLELGTTILSVNTGLRYDYNDFLSEHQLSPRLRFSINPNWKQDIVFRISTGLYYQSPELREMVAPDANFYTDIKSQKSIHYVLGTDYNFEAWDRPFKFVGEIFYKDLLHITPYTIDNVKIQYYPELEATGYATGIDMKVNGQFVPGTESWLSLSLLQTKQKIKDISDRWMRRPTDQLLNVGLYFQDYVPGYDRFRMHMTLMFGTKMPTGPDDFGIENSDMFTIPSYKRVDIGFLAVIIKDSNDPLIKKKGIKSLLAGLELFNLLDTQNTISFLWVEDVKGSKHSVPNFLTGRLLNVKVSARF